MSTPRPVPRRPLPAYRDPAFVESDCARPLRILSEYLAPLEAFRRERFDGESRDAVFLDKGSGDVVLGAEGVGRAHDNLRAAIPQRNGEIGGFGRNVQTRRYPDTLQRPLAPEALPDLLQHGHGVLSPFDPVFPPGSQARVLDIVLHHRLSLTPLA